MKKIKERWEITENWQLLFPFLGVLGLGYLSYKLGFLYYDQIGLVPSILVFILIFFVLLKFTLFLFKKLEKKWILDQKWEMIRVFIVFAITGSSSMFVGRPIIEWLGITKENLNPILYWVFIYYHLGLIFYQILLVSFGWLFGQFQFFWNFEKKMLRRFGLGRFID